MQLTKLRAAPVWQAEVPPCARAGRTDAGTASQLIRSVGLTVGWRVEGTPLPHGVRPTERVPTSFHLRRRPGHGRAGSGHVGVALGRLALQRGACEESTRLAVRSCASSSKAPDYGPDRGCRTPRSSARRLQPTHVLKETPAVRGGRCERLAPRRTTESGVDVPCGAVAVAGFRNGAARPGMAHGEAAWGSPTSGCS
jgi:hypothetical protein